MEQKSETQQAHLSRLASFLIQAFTKEERLEHEGRITVNPLISKFATWYEKLRNAMDYRDEEVILRAAIERILKRRMIVGNGGGGVKIAEPLVRELVWARYFPDEHLSTSSIEKVAHEIDLYTQLRSEIIAQGKQSEQEVTTWMFQLLSSSIEHMLNPQKEKELMSNFAYQIMRENIFITDDSEQNRDIQVFLAVRKAFAKDDVAFLRYHLFSQYFGKITEHNLSHIIATFQEGYTEIQRQLTYPRKETIYSYVKKKAAIFFILDDILRVQQHGLKEFVTNEQQLTEAVLQGCEVRYKSISARVRRAIIRSVFFLLLTKTFFAFSIEGTIERILYGEILWKSMLVNISIPPILMIIVGSFIRTPGKSNSQRILHYIKAVLFIEKPKIGTKLAITKEKPKAKPLIYIFFTIFWLLAFVISFGLVIFVLSKFHFNILSMGIFVFFLTIVSFLSYRIAMTSRAYTVEEKQGWFTPVIDFLFLPIVRVGSKLTQGISQINIFMFLLDFVFETPFKAMFGFFEQWFFFIHAKREGLD